MPATAALSALSTFIYGTTRLGDAALPRAERLAMARTAMASGVWFHTSDQYGEALSVLGEAFATATDRLPRLILKVGGDTPAQLRESIRRQLAPLGLKRLDLAQLCIGGALAEEFAQGGPIHGELRRMRDEGLVGGFLYEVFPWTSATPLQALRDHQTDELISAFIFYLNPLQRFASNPLWQLIQERQFPIIAMRTICGAPVHTLRDVPGAAWKDYLQHRAVEVAPIYERSGVTDWAEFSVRYAFGFPLVRATVGSTARPAHFQSLLRAAGNPQPLAAGIQADLAQLQTRWSDSVDIHAEPWTM